MITRKLILGLMTLSLVAIAAPKKSEGKRNPAEDKGSTWQPTGHAVPSPEYVARKYNIRVNPLNLLFGMLNADFAARVSKHFTVGPTVSYYTVGVGTVSLTGVSFGVVGTLYLSGLAISDSWYLSPSASYNIFTVSDSGGSASLGAISAGAIGGYRWVWPSGFNMSLGLGFAYTSVAATATLNNGRTVSTPGFTGVLPQLDFSLGYAF